MLAQIVWKKIKIFFILKCSILILVINIYLDNKTLKIFKIFSTNIVFIENQLY